MKKSLTVTLGVCLICSILVSISAVGLKSIQDRNKKRDQLTNILEAGDIDISSGNLEQLYQKHIEPLLIELKTGEILDTSNFPGNLTPQSFDIRQIMKDNNLTSQIGTKEDIAKIQRLPRYMVVYRVSTGDTLSKYILMVYGKGLWSTMYGFMALDKDLKTIRGFTFYEHGETPGLGGEVDNPNWKRQWIGKQAFDINGNIKIEVLKGKVNLQSPEAKYQIDGLSGSTLTTRGIHNLIRFWLGENGYKPFLNGLAVNF